jgi:hypothetical protein
MLTAAISETPTGRGNWMQTLTGKRFYPADPRAEELAIEDIAGALARQCRYSGHCLAFYSVAEHSVHVAAAAPKAHALTALLHDASEAYLVDIPRPIKPHLSGYAALESKLMEVIAARFGIEWPLPSVVKEIDNAILSDERRQNMAHMDVTPELWGNSVPALGVTLHYWPPQKASEEFIAAFHRYGGN